MPPVFNSVGSAFWRLFPNLVVQSFSCLFVLNYSSWAFLVAQTVTNPPVMRETWVRSLGWEDPLEEGMATHFSILAWRILMDKGAWWVIVHEIAKSWTRLND